MANIGWHDLKLGQFYTSAKDGNKWKLTERDGKFYVTRQTSDGKEWTTRLVHAQGEKQARALFSNSYGYFSL